MKKRRFIPWGRTLTTNDIYLSRKKTNSNKVRPVVVVDNYKDNLGVVPLSSRKGNNRTDLPKRKNKKTGQRTYYKHYFEIEDNEGQPIRVNEKFKENHKNMDLSREEVLDIRQNIFTKAKTKQRNKKLYDRLHRKWYKKWPCYVTVVLINKSYKPYT